MVMTLTSSGVGVVIGLIAVAIFAVILRRIEARHPEQAIRSLVRLAGLCLGGGLSDFVVFDLILKGGGTSFYLLGFSMAFIPLGLIIFLDWKNIPGATIAGARPRPLKPRNLGVN
jgi:hypothetical protein